ncbi:hypothetical protein A1D22_09320 [Pasteurellaceae bacterium LFhippo2]|nr:hypothetical protein [Pasteurellaceae bacterium LFhippo2]
MSGINKVIILGHLGQAPEVRIINNNTGDKVATISVATSEKWINKATGVKMESTEWHKIVFYSPLAKTVAEYLRKGSQVYVEGKLRTKKWTDKNGIDRYTTEIIAEKMEMCGGGAPTQANQTQAQQYQQADNQVFLSEQEKREINDEIPF